MERSGVAEREVIAQFLQGVDLLVSATAEHDVNRYLDRAAIQLGIPRLYLWSQSGYGGVVALLRHRQTGCYHCLNVYLSDQAKAGHPMPAVPDYDIGTVQGPGCADQTFTAAHADLLPISVQAVRLANGFLASSYEGGYPSFRSDVFVVQVREPDATPIPPRWTSFTLPPNPDCPICNLAQGDAYATSLFPPMPSPT